MNMLKIALPDAAENANLVELGHFRVHVKSSTSAITTDTNVLNFDSRDAGLTIKIIGEGNFLQSDMTTVIPGDTMVLAGTNVYVSNGDYMLDISNKYGVYRINLGINLYIDDSQEGVYPYLEYFKTTNEKSNMDLASFKKSSSFQSVNVSGSSVHGDVANLSGKNYLRYNNYDNCKDIVGDIASFGNCQLIESLNVKRTGVTGSIESLGACTNLATLTIFGTSITGTLANLAAAMAANGRTSGTLTFQDAVGNWSTVSFPYNP